MYRYIGNKTRLLPEIRRIVQENVSENGTVADIMAGTGTVSAELKRCGYRVIAADVMTYSRHHLVSQLLVNAAPEFKTLRDAGIVQRLGYSGVIEFLNKLPEQKSFFYNEFSVDGAPQNGCPSRKYFTPENAGKIDAIREEIELWRINGYISIIEESVLKHTLILAVNRIANISGTYGYFLSEYNSNSLEPLVLRPVDFVYSSRTDHTVLQGFAEELAPEIEADLCYIDPPYMKRQYAANYHILETIARGDFPEAIGKSGLRNWWDQHSKLCTKTSGLKSLAKIMSEMRCPTFLISYSEDGLFTIEQLKECFEAFGVVNIFEIEYTRFRSNNSPLPKSIKEYIIKVCKK